MQVPDPEKLPCSRCGKLILPATAARTGGLCRPCEKKEHWAQAPAQPDLPPEDEWELTPENAHPNARALLREPFFWDITDEGSPLGSDTGADTLSELQVWLEDHGGEDVDDFLVELMSGWGVDIGQCGETDPKALAQLLPLHEFHILTYDDAVIGLAFGQLVLRGKVDDGIRDDALAAIRRQGLPVVIRFRGWVDESERITRLEAMRRVLSSVQSSTS